jgi:hypothetical protein
VRRLHSSQHHYHLSHRGSIQYSDCGMLHRPALLHAALQVVGLMNQIRYMGQRWLRYLPSHPFPSRHVSLSCGNALRSDCSRLIGKLHCQVSHCTAHRTLKGWSDESDLKKTPFLSSICKLKVAYRERPYHSINGSS